MKGSVKFFKAQGGWGFITPQDGGKDIFYHISNFMRDDVTSVNEGQPVEYEVAQGKKGLEARAIKLLVA